MLGTSLILYDFTPTILSIRPVESVFCSLAAVCVCDDQRAIINRSIHPMIDQSISPSIRQSINESIYQSMYMRRLRIQCAETIPVSARGEQDGTLETLFTVVVVCGKRSQHAWGLRRFDLRPQAPRYCKAKFARSELIERAVKCQFWKLKLISLRYPTTVSLHCEVRSRIKQHGGGS